MVARGLGQDSLNRQDRSSDQDVDESRYSCWERIQVIGNSCHQHGVGGGRSHFTPREAI